MRLAKDERSEVLSVSRIIPGAKRRGKMRLAKDERSED